MDNLKQITERIQELDTIETLSRSKGWKYLAKHFEIVKQTVFEGMMKEPDMQQVLQLRERYRAYSAMLETVPALLKEKRDLEQELQVLTDEQKTLDNYGSN